MRREEAVRERAERLYKEMQSERIREAARGSEDEVTWTRQRKMPLKDILLCTLNKKGLSTTMELRHYFKETQRAEGQVSVQAYLKQRRKLNPMVFKKLNTSYLKHFYCGEEAEDSYGYLILAVDGTCAEIPNSFENRKVYGETKNQYGSGVARAKVSVLRDINNNFIIDSVIDTYGSGETEAAKAHIASLKETIGNRKALILFDRNYASFEFADYLESEGIKYLIRVKKGCYEAEKALIKGEEGETELACTKERLKKVKGKRPERAQALMEKGFGGIRLIKSVLDNGEEVFFISNEREISAFELKETYRKRWSIEQSYHTLKNKLKFESVTGKASIYVKQDFFAQMLIYNMVEDLIAKAQIKASEKGREKGLKYEVKINENIAMGLFKEQFVAIVMEEDEEIKSATYRKLLADMERNVGHIRQVKCSVGKWNSVNKYKCNLKPSF
jgi:hypothetical protein